MIINYKKLKTIVLSLVLVAGMLLPANSFAQNGGSRGLFGRGTSSDCSTSSEESLLRQGPTISGGITNDSFVETPLGGGIAILLVAGLGYVALKKKEDEQ